jgi:hypothetical protein
MRGMQCNVELGYQLNICSKDRGFEAEARLNVI